MMLFAKGQLADLEKKYDRNHALFVTNCASLLKRINTIGESNLEFYASAQKFNKVHEFIQRDHDEKARTSIEALKQFYAAKNSKAFQALYGPSKAIINAFEREVNAYTLELENLLQPEQETKLLVSKVKEEARLLRQNYHSKLERLTLVEAPFSTIFKNYDEYLLKLDRKIDSGEYDEIKLMVAKISKLTKEMEELLLVLPQLCVLIDSVLPAKMNNLADEAEALTKQGYPLHHLMIKDTLGKFSADMQTFKAQLQKLDTKGIEEKIQSMMLKIESFYPLFEKEKEAKGIFEKEYDPTYQAVNALERKFSKLNNAIPQYRQVYIIANDQLLKIDVIRKIISDLNMTKRGLDTLVLSATKQPYSLQVQRIETLKSDTEAAHKMMDEFSGYLAQLKSESEAAYRAVGEYNTRFKAAEHAVSSLQIADHQKLYQEQFDRYFLNMVNILDAIKSTPINMNTIQANMKTLKDEGEKFLAQVEKDMAVAALAEQTIMVANRDRDRLNDYHRILTLAEQSFFAGQYEKAYLEAGNLLKKIQQQKAK